MSVVAKDMDVPARFGVGAGGWQYHAESEKLGAAAYASPRPLDALVEDLRRNGVVFFEGVVTNAGNKLVLVGRGFWAPGPVADTALSLRYLDGFNALALETAGEGPDDEDDEDEQDEEEAPSPAPAPARGKPILNLGGGRS